MSMPNPNPSRMERDAARIRRVEELAGTGASAASRLLDEFAAPSWAVRRAIVSALARAGAEVVPVLCTSLRDDRRNEARIAGIVDALSASTADVDASVLELASDSNPAVVCDALQILGRRGSLPALGVLRDATRHADDNIALAAIEALGRIGGSAVIDALLEVVQGGNFFRVFPAIDVLGRAGDPRAIPALLGLSSNQLYAVEAARALGRIGDPSTANALVDWLPRSSETLTRTVAAALVSIHDRSQERFGTSVAVERALLHHPQLELTRRRLADGIRRADAVEQVALGRILAWVGEESAVPTLLALLGSSEPVSAMATEGLKRLADVAEPAVIEAIQGADSSRRRLLLPIVSGKRAALAATIECLADDDWKVRVLACEGLAQVGDDSAVVPVFKLLADADLRVSQAALAALNSLGSETTHRLAIEATTSPLPALRRAAYRLVGYFGYQAFDQVARGVHDVDERVRDAAVAALPALEDERVLDLLLETSRLDAAKARAAACRALGQMPSTELAVQRLREALGDRDPWVRYYSAQALGKLRDEGSVERLFALLSDPSGQVRVAVLDALARMRGERPLEVLTVAADSKDVDVRRAALLSLGISRRREALPVLLAALRSTEPATRLVAVSAVAELGMAEATPILGRLADDEDDGVRNAATGYLAGQTSPDATLALVALVSRHPAREDLVAALARPAAGRSDAIFDALQTADDEAARSLVAALARAHSDDSTRTLRSALASPNASCRRAVAAALIALDDAPARPALERAALGDPDPEVRRVSGAVLGR